VCAHRPWGAGVGAGVRLVCAVSVRGGVSEACGRRECLDIMLSSVQRRCGQQSGAQCFFLFLCGSVCMCICHGFRGGLFLEARSGARSFACEASDLDCFSRTAVPRQRRVSGSACAGLGGCA
jgi:hypothetical protein